MLRAMIDTVAETAGAPPADLKRTPRKKAGFSEDMAKLQRALPHSLEAEQGVLGCILLSPRECVGDCIEKFKAGGDVFLDERHKAIFQTVVEMYDKQQIIDPITLHQMLKSRQKLDLAGGMAYVASLPDMAPSPANLEFYAQIVQDKHLLRKMIETCQETEKRVFDHHGDVEVLLDEVERDILRISETRVEAKTGNIKALVTSAIGLIEDYHKRQGMLTGVGTGFSDLDKMTMGLHGGEMIVIAARPSMGKTSLAMNIAEHVVLEQKLPVGVFSLEMTAESLVMRM